MTTIMLPYHDLATAHEVVGPLPDDVEVLLYRQGPAPEGVERTEFYVLPYNVTGAGMELVAQMPKLRFLQGLSAGYENLIDRVPDQVALCNAAGVHDTSTAELAVTLALAQGRHIDRYARQRDWSKSVGHSIADQRVTILGYGRIGKAIEQRLAGFECASITKVASRARDDIHGVEELPQLLPQTDVLICVLPANQHTRGLLGTELLSLLPDDALVVNVGRGAVIDTDAMVEQAKERLRFALDVVDPEPLPQDHPLWDLERVLLVPHVGGLSTAFPARRDALIRDQVQRFIAGEPLENVVKPAR
ncbi:2-hydroxyacid dehydrogenase [Parenemella sanctibonifatiensis]|uniref:Dihydrofolate reductase n=1 Tax=Parenemella sanctibonifatiensis TaxID=2016505 RepID=A0A255EIC7_9ACTN|nr:2-hydroxyacid dehydrogenase [Parenemella sanctibonifatiensis]OYN91288.1 dihydrofolate reductase [Parenemella sanctibonifatiensis]